MLANKNDTDLKPAFEHMQQCDLCRDAFEGIKEMPDVSVMNGIQAKWQLKHRTKPLKKITFDLNTFYIIFTFALLIAISVIYFLFFTKHNHQAEVPKENAAKFETVLNPVFMNEQFVATDTVTLVSNDTVQINETASQPVMRHEEPVTNIPERGADLKQTVKQNGEVIALKQLHTATLELEDYLLIDYRSLYEKSNQLSQLQGGVNARYASKNEAELDSIARYKDSYKTTYEDVMSYALRLMNNGSYIKAIGEFNFVLQFFPSDLNCIFYKGICYEQTGDYESALKLYSEMNAASDNFFGEAVSYHSAFCLLKQNKKAESRVLLQNIIDHNGFYKSKAIELLKQF